MSRQLRNRKNPGFYARMHNIGLDALEEEEGGGVFDSAVAGSSDDIGSDDDLDVYEFNEDEGEQDDVCVELESDSDNSDDSSENECEDEGSHNAPGPAPTASKMMRMEMLATNQVYKSSDGTTTWTKDLPPAGKTHVQMKFNVTQSKPGVKETFHEIHKHGETKANMKTVFMNLFVPALMGIIVTCTNAYAEMYYRARNKVLNKTLEWKKLTVPELYAFMGLLLRAGVRRGRDMPIQEFWITDPTRRDMVFVATMPRDRFQEIIQFLRFDDVKERKPGIEKWIEQNIQARKDRRDGKVPESVPFLPTAPGFGKLRPVEAIWNLFIKNIQDNFVPDEVITVDEMLLKFKGRCSFRVYMPDKPGKYGLKIWIAVCTFTGYVINMQIYQGKVGDRVEQGLGQKVVMELTKDYLGVGRNVTADNFFASKSLVDYLLTKMTSFVGTMRKHRKEVPKPFLEEKTEVGDSSYLFSGDVTLLKFQAKKNKPVLLISSMHNKPENSTDPKDKGKPKMISYYNETKGGVDKADQMVGRYTCQRPTNRWPLKVLMCMLDVAALNAFQIWMNVFPGWKKSNRSRRREFLFGLTDALVKPIIEERSNHPPIPPHVRECMIAAGVLPKEKDRNIPENKEDHRVSLNYSTPCETEFEGKRCKRNTKTGCIDCMKPICLPHQYYRVLCMQCHEKEEKKKKND